MNNDNIKDDNNQEIDEIIVTIDISKLKKSINEINNSMANLGSGLKSSKFLTIKSSGSKNLINTNSIISNIEIDIPQCPHCKTKCKKKVGWLIKNGNILCVCGKTKFIIKQKG